ncbi:MAG: hypothetical protein NVSMB39_5140 [Candidatus Saccharimonadales bacterium]
MFKKMVSQLSLSPSAVTQLTFYGRRLAHERVARGLTAVAAVGLIMLQLAIVLFPPSVINAASPGDLIYGGLISKADLLNRYDESPELIAVFSALNISRADLDQTSSARVNGSDRTLKQLGRTAHSSDDFELRLSDKSYFMAPLYVWDTASQNYPVLEGTRAADGSYFAVLISSGNILSRTYPPTPAATPAPAPSPAASPKLTTSPKPGKATPKSDPAALICASISAAPSAGTAPLITSIFSPTAAAVTSYLFDFGDGTAAKASASPSLSHTYASAGIFGATVQLKNITGATTATCKTAVTVTATAASYIKSKTAVNLTQNIAADTRPASGGDVIKYHLTTKNVGGTAGQYVVIEHLQDVLEYADITDLGGGRFNDGVLTWPATFVAPGASISSEFTVRIKNPIPDTPIGLSDKFSYDLRLDNVYGNTVRINIAPSIPKQIEIAAASLPGASAPVATTIVLLISLLTLYFYYRNRQLQTEVKLLRVEYEGGL